MTIGKKLDGYSSAAKAHMDELLDEALNETFPASDPVAINMERTSDQRVAASGVVPMLRSPTATTRTKCGGIWVRPVMAQLLL